MTPFASLTVTAVLGDGLNHMTGIAALDSMRIGGVDVLYAASMADGGLTAWRLDGGVAVLVDQLGYTDNRGTRGVGAITLTEIAGQPLLLPSGRWDDRLSLHELGADGGFERVHILGADPDKIGALSASVIVPVGDTTWMLASQWGRDGVQITEIRGDLSLNPLGPVTQTGTADLSDITAMASLQIGDTAFVFTLSATGNSVSSFTIDAAGNLQEHFTRGTSDGLAIDTPTVLEAVHFLDKSFVVIGSAGTSTIDVLKVSDNGKFALNGRAMDDRTTRFDDISALDVLETDGRHFVFAGGSDDGISMFEITSQGELFHVLSLAQPLGSTLADITAIEAVRIEEEIQVFISGEDLPGVTQLSIDASNLGTPIYGTNGKDKLLGRGNDDILEGKGNRDKIRGGRGDDRIVDGKGKDVLLGDKGADVFCFIPDELPDIVRDFQPGIDKLDMSAYPMLYSMDQLSYTQKGFGVVMEYNGERFRAELKEGQLLIEDLSPGDFIF